MRLYDAMPIATVVGCKMNIAVQNKFDGRPQVTNFGLRLWMRWVLANAFGEVAGLGLAAAIGALAVSLIGEPHGLISTLWLSTLMIFAGTIEGLIVGMAQCSVLREPMKNLSAGKWVLPTALGAFIAWVLGMIPSTLMHAQESPSSASQPEISDAIVYSLATLMGAALGSVLAIPQWLTLRKYFAHAGWWIVANSLAWACGMPIIFFAVGIVAVHGLNLISAIETVAAIGLAGAVVGAVHGLALVWLVNHQSVHSNEQ